MIAWRFVTGMGIGAEIAIVSTYIGELAPASMRGRYTGWINVFSFVGLALVPIAALWLVPNFSWGWRAMFAICALGIVTLPALAYLPESPRWLIGKQRHADAEVVIEAAEKHAGQQAANHLAPLAAAVVEVKFTGFPTARLFHTPYLSRMSLLLVMWFLFYVGEYIWLGLGPTFFVDRGYRGALAEARWSPTAGCCPSSRVRLTPRWTPLASQHAVWPRMVTIRIGTARHMWRSPATLRD